MECGTTNSESLATWIATTISLCRPADNTVPHSPVDGQSIDEQAMLVAFCMVLHYDTIIRFAPAVQLNNSGYQFIM